MKKVISILMACILVLSLAACKTNEQGSQDSNDEIVLTIPHYKTGANVGAKFFLPLVDRFNEKYKGIYKIEIEEVPQDDYHTKIKLLQQQGKLPALIEGAEKQFMEEVIIANNLYYDFSDWLDSKPEIKDLLVQESIEFNDRDGKIVSMPIAVIRPIGMYFNKDMFESAGIEKSIGEMNFTEFEEALEKIKADGNTPLALMTGENAWTTMLLFCSIMASEEGGAEILQAKELVYDYTSTPWINSFRRLQSLLQNYTTENAIGAVYADAANNFLNERTATIANGPWMVGDFSDNTKTSEGFKNKVGGDIYPGGVAISYDDTYNWWIPSTATEEEIEVALAFLEFMYLPEELEAYMLAEGGNAPKLKVSENFKSQLDPVLLELSNAIENNLEFTVPHMYAVWPDQIVNTEFGKYLPKLADGSLTPEEFADALTNKAKQFK